MSFTIVTSVIFTAFAASLARESVHGARRETVDTQSGPQVPAVVRVVLNATANGSGEGSQSAFYTADKHLVFRRMSGEY